MRFAPVQQLCSLGAFAALVYLGLVPEFNACLVTRKQASPVCHHLVLFILLAYLLAALFPALLLRRVARDDAKELGYSPLRLKNLAQNIGLVGLGMALGKIALLDDGMNYGQYSVKLLVWPWMLPVFALAISLVSLNISLGLLLASITITSMRLDTDLALAIATLGLLLVYNLVNAQLWRNRILVRLALLPFLPACAYHFTQRASLALAMDNALPLAFVACAFLSTLIHAAAHGGDVSQQVELRTWVHHFVNLYCFAWVRPAFSNLNLLLNDKDAPIALLPNKIFNGCHLIYLVLVQSQRANFAMSMSHGWIYLALMSFVDPIAMHELLLSDDSTTLRRDLLLALLLSASMLVRVSCMEVCFFYSVKATAKSRTILQYNLFHRMMQTIATESEQTRLLLPTLVSNDAERFGASCWIVFFFASWTFALVSLPLTLWVLTYLVGLGAALLGTGIMVFGGLITREIARCSQRGFETLNLKRDARSQILLRCLGAMLQIKMSATEQYWENELKRARREEVSTWLHIRYALGLSNASSTLVQGSVSILVFAYITLVDGRELTAAGAFSTLLVLSQLSWSVGTLPDIFNLYSSLMPCANRLVEHLNAHPLSQQQQQQQKQQQSGEDVDDSLWLLEFINAQEIGFGTKLFTLPGPFRIGRGELVLVTGAVGSGKSCLLQHIAATTEGLQRKVYLAQTPFLFNGTIRENICFGGNEPVDDEEQAKFQRATGLAQLHRDLQVLPQGANTMVGDGGVQLSGGQRARIALARALYFAHETDLFIIDDLFASVDAATGHTIFRECICEALLGANKSVILAASHATREIYLRSTWRIDIDVGTAKCTASKELMDDVEMVEAAAAAEQSFHPNLDLDMEKPEEEVEVQRGISRADFFHYWSRFTTFRGSPWLLLTLVFGQAFVEFFSPYWLSHWTLNTSEHGLAIYAAIQVAFVLLAQIIFIFTTMLALAASGALHDLALARLFRAPMSLFDSTPHGKIAQVLLGDLRNMDEGLPESAISQIKRSCLALFQVLAIMHFAPIILLVLPVLFFMYRWILNQVRLPSLGIKRLEAQSHGPVLASFLDAMRGKFSLVHSGKMAVRFAGLFRARLFRAEQTRVGSEAVSKFAQALAVQSGCVLYLTVSVAGVLAMHHDGMANAKLGLILTFAGMLQRTGMDLMMGWTSFETNLVSVERVVKLMQSPMEEEDDVEETVGRTMVPLASGSTRALGIEFENVTLRYRADRPLVLRGVSFTIQPGDKVCIVGRTGEGKSSLILALLRLYPTESGRILIHNWDIGFLPLAQIRRHICRVILQDCKLTERTLRENLVSHAKQEDASDLQLQAILHRVGLTNKCLDDVVLTESGLDLLSAGERQLVCIARALHSLYTDETDVWGRGGILICDECTSFVSDELDQRVHDEILALRECTVLAIVHRQTQLARFDYQLVVDKGRVVDIIRN